MNDDMKGELLAGKELKGKTILYCEDNEINVSIVTHILKNAGASVETAENGLAGIRLFEESETGYYSAVLMDIKMPVMGGFEACEAIRTMERPDAATVPVIGISSDDYKPCDLFTDFIKKPFAAAELIQALATSTK